MTRTEQQIARHSTNFRLAFFGARLGDKTEEQHLKKEVVKILEQQDGDGEGEQIGQVGQMRTSTRSTESRAANGIDQATAGNIEQPRTDNRDQTNANGIDQTTAGNIEQPHANSRKQTTTNNTIDSHEQIEADNADNHTTAEHDDSGIGQLFESSPTPETEKTH